MNLGKYFSKDRFSLRQVVGILTVVIIRASALVYATVTIPHTFTAGDTARAGDVNANFQALANAINNRTSATLANMAGTWDYTMVGSYITMNTAHSSTIDALCTNSRAGTLTLNADGTFSDNLPNPVDYCTKTNSSGSPIYVDYLYGHIIPTSPGSGLNGTWIVSSNGSGTLTYTSIGVTVPFRTSRDLNTMNSIWNDTTGSTPGNATVTYLRQ